MKKDIDVNKIKQDLRGVLEKTKTGLKKMGEETSVFAKRGEKELARLTKLGRVEVGILGLNLKKNQLFYELGKKVYQLDTQNKLTTKNLKKLCGQISRLEKDVKIKKRSVKRYLKQKS